jgi:hypothetical protein
MLKGAKCLTARNPERREIPESGTATGKTADA